MPNKTPKELLEYNKRYYEANKDKFKKYYAEHKEEIVSRSSQFKKEHPEKVKEYFRNYVNKDPEAYLRERRIVQDRYSKRNKDVKVECKVCNKLISKLNYNQHSYSKKHQEKILTDTHKNDEGTKNAEILEPDVSIQ